jgi:hypothetical protein
MSEPIIASGGAGAPAENLLEGEIEAPTIRKKLKFSVKTEDALKGKVAAHNAEASDNFKAELSKVRAVYRRGAKTSPSTYTDVQRIKNAESRVDSYLALLKSNGASTYSADTDLLPATHPRSSALVASISDELRLEAVLRPQEFYETDEHAIFSIAEFSDLGYEVLPAIRAAWMRAIREGDNPFDRAVVLASALYESPDADLLPTRGIL